MSFFGLGNVMGSVIQSVIDRSKLEITLMRITKPTKDSFCLTMESRVSGTGPVSSVMSTMTVDLGFKGEVFGKLTLPETNCSAGGTAINVSDQLVQIESRSAFEGFVRSLMLDKELVLELSNGHCSIKAVGLTSKCVYAKNVHLLGMDGPTVEVIDISPSTAGKNLVSTMKLINPSPMEMEHGVSMFELLDESGETVAELEGDLVIIRGECTIINDCKARKAAPASGALRLVGKGVEADSWCGETIKNINVMVQLPERTRKVFG